MTVKFKIEPFITFYIDIGGINTINQLPPQYKIPAPVDVRMQMTEGDEPELTSSKPTTKLLIFELEKEYQTPYYKLRTIE